MGVADIAACIFGCGMFPSFLQKGDCFENFLKYFARKIKYRQTEILTPIPTKMKKKKRYFYLFLDI